MATLAPFGFQAGQSRRSINEYYVPASDTSAYAVGDVVRTNGNVFTGRLPDSRVSNGMLHVTKAAPGVAVRGVIVGIVAGPGDNSAQSVPAVKTRPYTLLVNDRPETLWDIQANNTTQLSVMAGTYASYTVGGPLGSVSSTVVDADSIGATVSDLLITEVLRNDGANSLLRVAFVQHEMAAAGGSPQIGAQIQSLVSGAWNQIPVDTPAGYRWTSHGFRIVRRVVDGAILTDFDPTTLIPAATITYFVDPVNGLDANSGLTRLLPLKNLATALAKTDVDQIRIINLASDFIARTTAGWNNTQPSRSVSVINEGPGRFVSVQCASASLPTWAVNGTFGNVYSTTIASASATGVCDLSARLAHPTLDPSATAKQAQVLASVARPFRTLKKVASLALVAAEAGTWFHDGTSLHVRAFDDRSLVGDTLMQPTANGNNGRFTSTVANLTIYAQGIDFVGGRPFYATVVEASAVSGCVLVANDCTFQGGGLANGLAIEFNMTAYLYRCGAFLNWNDGFNYHCPTSPAAAGLTTSPNVVEVECVAYGNGTTGSSGTSDNASTAHEYTNSIRINCLYPSSDDRVLADVNVAHSWVLASYVGQSVKGGAGNQNIVALDSARMWVDSPVLATGASNPINADGTAVIALSNAGAITNQPGSTGTVRAYLG